MLSSFEEYTNVKFKVDTVKIRPYYTYVILFFRHHTLYSCHNIYQYYKDITEN